MKKFLFTLAALFMVGTAFADNYLYIEDFSVTPEFLAQEKAKDREVTVPVKAHFDNCVQGWEFYIRDYDRDNMTMRNGVAGSDLTQHGYDRVGNEKDFTTTLKMGDAVESFIVAWDENWWLYLEGDDPDDDPTACGAVQFRPGDYNEMFLLTIRFAKTFTGADMTLETGTSGHESPLGEYAHNTEPVITKVCHITVKGGSQETTYAPEPTFRVEDGKLYAEQAGYTVVLMINDEEVANPYPLPAPTYEGEQTIAFTAYTVKNTEDENSATVPYEVVIPVKADAKAPAPQFSTVDGKVYVTPENAVVTVNGVEVTMPYELPAATFEAQEVTFVGYTVADGVNYNINSDETTYTATVEPKADAKAPAPQFRTEDGKVYVTPENAVVTVNGAVVEMPYELPEATFEAQQVTFVGYTPADGVNYNLPSDEVTYVATVAALDDNQAPEPTFRVADGKVYAEVGNRVDLEVVMKLEGTVCPNPYTLPEPTDVDQVLHFTAYTVADGQVYNVNSNEVPFEYTVKAKEPVVTEVGAPTFNGYSVDGITGYGCTITPTTSGSQIKYRVLIWNAETQSWDLLEDWQDYDGEPQEIFYTNVGAKYRVEAYAFIGDVRSEEVAYEFSVTTTGIDEMMGGKTVAGVRYFNMAGQEMQEANGMTIVVTTYTDGTTSAVKVMK